MSVKYYTLTGYGCGLRNRSYSFYSREAAEAKLWKLCIKHNIVIADIWRDGHTHTFVTADRKTQLVIQRNFGVI